MGANQFATKLRSSRTLSVWVSYHCHHSCIFLLTDFSRIVAQQKRYWVPFFVSRSAPDVYRAPNCVDIARALTRPYTSGSEPNEQLLEQCRRGRCHAFDEPIQRSPGIFSESQNMNLPAAHTSAEGPAPETVREVFVREIPLRVADRSRRCR